MPKTQDWAKIWVGIHNGIDEPFWLRTFYSYKSTSVEPAVSDHPKYNEDLAVAHKNRTTGRLFQEEVQTHLLYGR